MNTYTTQTQITPLPEHEQAMMPVQLIDARSYQPFADKPAHPGCGFRSETLVHEQTGLCLYRHLTTPISCQTYTDHRTQTEEQLAKMLVEIAKECDKMEQGYLKVKRKRNNADMRHGGSCTYRPFLVVINNYGWSIHARSEEDCVIEYFQ